MELIWRMFFGEVLRVSKNEHLEIIITLNYETLFSVIPACAGIQVS